VWIRWGDAWKGALVPAARPRVPGDSPSWFLGLDPASGRVPLDVLDTLRHRLGPVLAVVAPAWPHRGFRTLGGYVNLHGVPVLPASGVARMQSLAHRLAAAGERVSVLTWASLREGLGRVVDEMLRAAHAGVTCLVADAVEDDDLAILGHAVHAVPVPILPVGTPAFAGALARMRYAGSLGSNAAWLELPVRLPVVRPRPVLVVSASLEPAPVRALEGLTADVRTVSLAFEADWLGAGGDELAEVRALAQALLAGMDGALVAVPTLDDQVRAARLASELGIDEAERRQRLLELTVRRLAYLLDRVPEVHLVLVGADLAGRVVEQLAPSHLEVRAELPAGTPVLGLPGDPRGVVIWDPVVQGPDELPELVRSLRALLTGAPIR